MNTKNIIIIVAAAVVLLATLGIAYLFTNGFVKEDSTLKSNSIHQFKVTALDGSEIDFSDFKGKKILLVNTASKCGFTPQYEGLERLYQKYQNSLVIVGFPSNDFLFQEPGENQEIEAFCKQNYGVSFPMASKIEVKGKNQAPIYQWLTHKSLNGKESSSVKWNFQKYLLDEQGQLLKHFSSSTEPEDPEIIKIIESTVP